MSHQRCPSMESFTRKMARMDYSSRRFWIQVLFAGDCTLNPISTEFPLVYSTCGESWGVCRGIRCIMGDGTIWSSAGLGDIVGFGCIYAIIKGSGTDIGGTGNV